ncbi:MAG: NAD(P)-dependent oxidoreductase [Candidatus Jorgensenbacteria bacterium]|nr:NAD(P)-dependent oxidoreductase [Candidatus Jorgensenbacteria bacterium]
MKIVIFGGRGFIGTALQKKAREKSHEITVFDLTKEDIRDPKTFQRLLEAEKADVVINLAAILGTMKESPSVQDLFETNVMGNLKVLKSSYDAGIRNYIFTSSMTVHGENEIGDHRTRFSPFNPKHGYSASKASAEFSMMQFLKEAPGMKIVAVRPTMVLGKGTYLPHAPIDFIKTILSGKNIEIYGEGLHEREWIWIDDVAEGILKAVEYALSADAGYYPFFLSSVRISMRDLANKVADKLGGKVVFVPSTKQAFTLTSDFSESQSLLKWSPKNGIDDMIGKLIDILRS